MLEASSSLGSTKLIATRAYQSHDLKHRPEAGAASAQGAYDARLSSRQTASVVIRVWTLCIIRSVPEQRQTISAALIWFDAVKQSVVSRQISRDVPIPASNDQRGSYLVRCGEAV